MNRRSVTWRLKNQIQDPRLPHPYPLQPAGPARDDRQPARPDGRGPTLGSTADRTLAGHPQSAGRDPRLVAAIRTAWPGLNESGLAQLRPDLIAATTAIGAGRLTEHLTANTGGALNPVAVLRTRLRNLPPPPQIIRAVAWCGRCSSPTYRWVEDASGFPIEPCPRCSGQARAKGRRGGPTTIDGADRQEHDAPPDRHPLRPTG